MAYKQYILPLYRCPSGMLVEVRINTTARRPLVGTVRGAYDNAKAYVTGDVVAYGSAPNRVFWMAKGATTGHAPAVGAYWEQWNNLDFYQSDPTDALFLDKSVRCWPMDGLGQLGQHMSREEGKLTADNSDYSFYDINCTYTGANGALTPVSINPLSTAAKSLFNEIYNDPLTIARHFRSRVKLVTESGVSSYTDSNGHTDVWEHGGSYSGGALDGVERVTGWVRARELYSIGDAKVNLITGEETVIYAPGSSNAIQVQKLKVTVDVGVTIAGSYKISDTFPLVSTSDFVDGTPRQFIGGLSIGPGNTDDGRFASAANLNNYTQDVGNGSRYGFKIVYPLRSAIVSENDGLHLILDSHWVAILAETMNAEFDEATGIQTGITAWRDYQTSGYIMQSKNLAENANVSQVIGSIYEWLVGSDPRCDLHVAQLTSDATFAWDAPLSTAIEKISRQYLCKYKFDYNQATKKPVLSFRDFGRPNTEAGGTLNGALTNSATSMPVNSFAAINTIYNSDGTTRQRVYPADYPFLALISNAQQMELVEITNNTAGASPFVISRIQTGLAWADAEVVEPVRTVNPVWRVKPGMKRDAMIVSQAHVEINEMGDSDILCCPKRQGDGLTIGTWRRGKKVGPIDARMAKNSVDYTYNTNVSKNGQFGIWNTFSGGYAQLRDGGGIHIHGTDGSLDDLGTSSGVHGYTLFSGGHEFNRFELANVIGTEILSLPLDLNAQPNYLLALFPNGAVGLINHIYDRNKIRIVFNPGATQPSAGPFPTANTEFLIGYGAWIDITVTEGSKTATTTHDLSVNDIFGNPFIGQQIVVPFSGIHNIVDFVLGTHTITLDSPANATGTVLMYVGGPEINSNGWLPGSFSYFNFAGDASSTDLDRLLPDTGYNNSGSGANPVAIYTDDASNYVMTVANRRDLLLFRGGGATMPTVSWGAYAVSRFEYGATSMPDDNHGNSIYTAAQYYARQFIGTFSQPERTFDGILGADLTMAGRGLQDVYREYREGEFRNYFVDGLTTNETDKGKGSSHVFLREIPDLSAPLDSANFPVFIKGVGGSSGGAGGVNGNGTGTTIPSGSGAAGITWAANQVLITLVTTGTNDDLGVTGATLVTLSAIGAAATITGLAGSGIPQAGLTLLNNTGYAVTLANNSSSSLAPHRILTGTGADLVVNDGYNVTLVYDGTFSFWHVVSIGTGSGVFLYKNPSAVVDNTLTPASDIVALTHKGVASQTANFEEWRSSAGTLLARVSKDGAIYISPGDHVPITAILPLASASDLIQLGDTNVASKFYVTFAGKAFAQGMDASSALITNVLDPVSAQDAATKNYVDVTASGLNVILSPATGSRNTIQNSTANTALVLKEETTQTASLLTWLRQDAGASRIILDHNGIVQVGAGGTAITSYSSGDLLYASGSTTLSKRAIGSTGDVLTVSGGAPSWVAPVDFAVYSGGGIVVANSTGYYATNGYSGAAVANSVAYQVLVTRARTLRNFYVILDIPPGIADIETITLYKNGVATALVVIISGGASVSGHDTTSAVSVAAGDYLSIQIVSTVTSATTQAAWGIEANNA